MFESEFQIAKGIAVAAALLFAAGLQFLMPYRRGGKEVFLNWKVNFPQAVLNLLIVSAVCGGCACLVAQWADASGIGLLNVFHAPLPWRVVLGVLALDFTAYAWHRANHRLAVLWRFHAVHHSDRLFDASTAVRFHPGEILTSLVVRLAVVSALGIPVVGILAFEMIYAGFNFFEHGNIRLSSRVEALVGSMFVIPAFHRKHHSTGRSELNSNYGTIFSFWDRLFRTHLRSSSTEQITVGLPDEHPLEPQIAQLLTMPFRRLPRAQ